MTTNTPKPQVSRKRTQNNIATRVLALRRTHSAKAVADKLGIPLGTVKTISSRAGITRNNERMREFFCLPEPAASACTEVAQPAALPDQVRVTGHKDVDAVLWLRSVVQTGDPDLIEKALEAAKRITTPAKDLELEYGAYLARTTGSSFVAALSKRISS